MEPSWSFPIPMAMYPTPRPKPDHEDPTEARLGRSEAGACGQPDVRTRGDRPSTASEIGRAQSELQSLSSISYAVFCLDRKSVV